MLKVIILSPVRHTCGVPWQLEGVIHNSNITCVDTPGSYYCVCPEGYYSADENPGKLKLRIEKSPLRTLCIKNFESFLKSPPPQCDLEFPSDSSCGLRLALSRKLKGLEPKT